MVRDRIISGVFGAFIFVFILTSCYPIDDNMRNSMFLGKEFQFTKREIKEYTHEISTNQIVINSNCNDLNIEKSDINYVKINMTKVVGGASEDNLQQELDSIQCTFLDDGIQLGISKDDTSPKKSKKSGADVVVPKDVTSLTIQSKNGNINLQGDLDSLKIDLEKGDIFYKGELKKGNIYSDHGGVEMELEHLENNYNYDIDGTIGDIQIRIPKENFINLKGSMAEKIKLEKGVNIGNVGPIFNINKTIDTKKIVAEIEISKRGGEKQ